jgi:hypothetical protein
VTDPIIAAPKVEAISNTDFLWALLKALIALALSAAILIPGYLTFKTSFQPPKDKITTPRTYNGSDFTVIMGIASENGRILELQELSDDGRAIIVRRTHAKAHDYPFVQYKITNRHPGEIIYLIWKTAEKPKETYRTRLYWSGDKVNSFNMAKVEGWKGTIKEVGFDIYGDLRDESLIIGSLTLTPSSWSIVLSVIWSEWTAFKGWNLATINQYRGTPQGSILSPSLAMSCWVGLTLLLLGAYYLKFHTVNFTMIVIVILVPWVFLDQIWQHELSSQLRETKYLFQGKSILERHAFDFDGELYSYIDHLKKDVLPLPGPRIYLLHNSEGNNFYRLRAHYHLLPHNTFSFGKLPPKKHLKGGEVIVLLGQNPRLSYDIKTKSLRWLQWEKYKWCISADQLDSNPHGRVFRVRSTPNKCTPGD